MGGHRTRCAQRADVGGSLGTMPRSSPSRLRHALITVLVGLTAAACGTISTSPPAPTPADFQGIATELTKREIAIGGIVSGEAGCDDPVLIPTAIAFDASGLDQADEVRIYLYVFRNRAAFERLRASVDDCAAAFVTDPTTFESAEQSPYVVAGQGPWGLAFEAAVRDALLVASGTGN
jgi:hypothetical protein